MQAKSLKTTLHSAFALTAALTLSVGSAFAACAPDKVSIRGSFGQIDFTVEIADDYDERALGLMHREDMPRNSGMLFIYERPQRLAFWMRNTLIPLDMLFINPDGQIAHIHENAVPLDETSISGGRGRIAVLEVNGGLSRQLGISVGDELRHPAFAQDKARWPCSN